MIFILYHSENELFTVTCQMTLFYNVCATCELCIDLAKVTNLGTLSTEASDEDTMESWSSFKSLTVAMKKLDF